MIRVRAQNAAGWGECSPTLGLNYSSHPSLFPAGFQIQQRLDMQAHINAQKSHEHKHHIHKHAHANTNDMHS